MKKKVAFPPYRTMKPLEWCYSIIFGCLVRSKDGKSWEAWIEDHWSPGEFNSVSYWVGNFLKKEFAGWQKRTEKIIRNEFRHIVDVELPLTWRKHA